MKVNQSKKYKKLTNSMTYTIIYLKIVLKDKLYIIYVNLINKGYKLIF